MNGKMKTKSIIAVAGVLLIILAAAFSAYAEESAGQEEFLAKMAQGITERLAAGTEDESKMTKEELADHYLELVELELAQIGQYEEKKFADKTFDELAHMYISACRMQQCAVKNYKNDNLYNLLWSGGRTARCAIIVEMYERYDLGITEEQVSEYRQ